MPQNIALQARTPQFDYSTPLLRAEKIKQAEMATRGLGLQQQALQSRNQMSALELADAQAKAGATNRYRSAAQAGDKNALKELTGFPDIQANFYKALESMKPSEKEAVAKRSNAFGTSARYIASFPAGSPERKAAELAELDKLRKKGFIDDAQHAEWTKTGVSDMLLHEAMSAEDWVKMAIKAEEDGLKPTDVAAIETRVASYRQQRASELGLDPQGGQFPEPQQLPAAQAKLEEDVATFRNQLWAQTGKKVPGGPSEGEQARTRAKRVADQFAKGLDRVARPSTGSAAKPKVPASHKDAVKVESPEHLRSLNLPPGTPIILPDGRAVWTK